ncbi:energy transducer TonB [Halalkalibaculum sp. DA3122]|uniref:energy transducer TonB n=1 Tax=unclassified Halalkalibaculum TaxID=2964617 RepID=UPI003754A134
MGTIIVAEVLMIALFLFWPVEQKSGGTYQDFEPIDDAIAIEDVQITTQRSSPPPPPTPQVPVPVPNDQIIEEEPIVVEELNRQNLPNPIEEIGTGPGGEGDQVAANPEQSPSLVRIVEPTVPEEAKKADIKAEIWVSFLVNTEGNVEEASISRIKLYDKKGDSFEIVNSINYGLTEATLEAALKWKFRPAKNNGEPVKAFTEHIFSFGF